MNSRATIIRAVFPTTCFRRLPNPCRAAICLLAALGALLLFSSAAPAQAPSTPSTTATSAPAGRLILVLPFENHSGLPNLDWVGESFPFILNQRLASAGFLPIRRDDREFALDHLGLPPDFKPSRATTLRIAQTLDADYVIVGSFTSNDGHVSAQAQVLNVRSLRMGQPIEDSARLERLLDLENAVAWKIAREMLPGYSVAEQTFIAASSSVKLDAFENYIRGEVEAIPDERLRHLKLAVQIAPDFAPAVLALGKTYYGDQDYDRAAATLSTVPPSDPLSLEAGFYLGLSYFNTANYAKAEAAFARVASQLPLPEVVNNQGVAASRQGHDAAALFTQAETADPRNPTYHYNLAVALRARKDFAGAMREVSESLRLKPDDPEALDLQHLLKNPATAPVPASSAENSASLGTSPASAPSATPAPATAAAAQAQTDAARKSDEPAQPVERIRRTYSEASFRQAAFEMDQMRVLRMKSLPPATQAAQFAQLGSDYLGQGLVLEAEKEFQSALALDSANWAAHAGLAQVRERTGDANAARAEAQASLKLKPNVAAYLVLAHLDAADNNVAAAQQDVDAALRLEPRNAAAQGMQQALAAKGQPKP